MHRSLITIVALTAGLTAALAAEQDIVLRGMGSFHVGGRVVEISGKPVREIVRQPGGPLTKLDPNGQYMVEQMYVQYFLPKERKGSCRCCCGMAAGSPASRMSRRPTAARAG